MSRHSTAAATTEDIDTRAAQLLDDAEHETPPAASLAARQDLLGVPEEIPATVDRAERRRKRRTERANRVEKQEGLQILTDSRREELETIVMRSTGLRRAWAKSALLRDDNRRFTAAERIEQREKDGFVRELAQSGPGGYAGAGGGRWNVISRLMEWRATTIQVAGIWPWAVGARSRLVGTIVGVHQLTGALCAVCPMEWFKQGIITAPIEFVIGLNGFGKSSFVRRQVLGAMSRGTVPLVLGDIKPDYRDLITACGGQVVDLGYGAGVLNPLEVGALGRIIDRLDDEDARESVRQDVRARQVALVCGLMEIVRGSRIEDFEESIITDALRELYRPVAEGGRGFTPEQPPILSDMLDVVKAGGAETTDAAGERGHALWLDAAAKSQAAYDEATVRLQQSLRALIAGPFGSVFNGHTTTQLDVTTLGVCVDVSKVPQGDTKLKAAVLMVCWATGFGAVEAAHRLADVGLAPRREFLAVMDELWQVLGAGAGMVDRVNELTRVNRTQGTAMLMITHSIADLSAFDSPADVKKAVGFIEKARIVAIGPIPEAECDALAKVAPLTPVERAWVTGWSASAGGGSDTIERGAAGRSRSRTRRIPEGMGKFIIKDSENDTPGIPIQMSFTELEKSTAIHNTNARFITDDDMEPAT